MKVWNGKGMFMNIALFLFFIKSLICVNMKKDFDTADYDYVLDSYSKMLQAIFRANEKIETFLDKKQVK